MNSGKQYGLLIRKKQQPQIQNKSVFEDSDDEPESKKVEKLIVKESMKNLVKRQTQVAMKKALDEDPTVYDYDNIYEDIQKKKEIAKAAVVPKEKKARYIQSLMKSADHRKKENERRIERQIQKERQEEGEKYAEKEAFVTSAYKKKMQEMQEEEEREERESRLEEMMDVKKQKDLSGFYRHFLNQTTGEEAIPEFGKRFSASSSGTAIKTEKLSPTREDETDSNAPDDDVRNKAKEALVKRRPPDTSTASASDGPRKLNQNEDLDTDISSDSNSSKSSSPKERNLKATKTTSEALSDKKRDSIPEKRSLKETDEDAGSSSDVETKRVKRGTSKEKGAPRLDSSSESGSESPSDRDDVQSKSEPSRIFAEESLQVITKDGSKSNSADGSATNLEGQPKKKRRNIFDKRTVGDVFTAAKERYLARKEARETARRVFSSA